MLVSRVSITNTPFTRSSSTPGGAVVGVAALAQHHLAPLGLGARHLDVLHGHAQDEEATSSASRSTWRRPTLAAMFPDIRPVTSRAWVQDRWKAATPSARASANCPAPAATCWASLVTGPTASWSSPPRSGTPPSPRPARPGRPGSGGSPGAPAEQVVDRHPPLAGGDHRLDVEPVRLRDRRGEAADHVRRAGGGGPRLVEDRSYSPTPPTSRSSRPTTCAATPVTPGSCSTSTDVSVARSRRAGRSWRCPCRPTTATVPAHVPPGRGGAEQPVGVRAGDRLLLAAVRQHRTRTLRGFHPQRLRQPTVRPAVLRPVLRARSARWERGDHAEPCDAAGGLRPDVRKGVQGRGRGDRAEHRKDSHDGVHAELRSEPAREPRRRPSDAGVG